MARTDIIIPVYNAKKTIEKCIESAVNQGDVRVIAVNDGSKDNSLEILRELEEKHENLTVYDKPNGGAGSARNLGLDKSDSKYVKFLDADDTLPNGVLSKMVDFAEDKKLSLVRGNMVTVIGPIKGKDRCSWTPIEGTQVIEVSKNPDFIVTETPGIGNKLFSRDVIGDSRFPEETKWEDLGIIPTLIAASERVGYLDEDVYNYRIHANTTLKDFVVPTDHILDVVKCCDMVEQGMDERGLLEQYKEQVEGLYALHTLFRVENAELWFLRMSKYDRQVLVSSLLSILESKGIDYENNRFVKQYRGINGLFNFDMKRLDKFINSDFKTTDLEIAKRYVNTVFSRRH